VTGLSEWTCSPERRPSSRSPPQWPGDVDLDPDVLCGTFEPEADIRIERRTVEERAVGGA
jgi:hypothetical protein